MNLEDERVDRKAQEYIAGLIAWSDPLVVLMSIQDKLLAVQSWTSKRDDLLGTSASPSQHILDQQFECSTLNMFKANFQQESAQVYISQYNSTFVYCFSIERACVSFSLLHMPDTVTGCQGWLPDSKKWWMNCCYVQHVVVLLTWMGKSPFWLVARWEWDLYSPWIRTSSLGDCKTDQSVSCDMVREWYEDGWAC